MPPKKAPPNGDLQTRTITRKITVVETERVSVPATGSKAKTVATASRKRKAGDEAAPSKKIKASGSAPASKKAALTGVNNDAPKKLIAKKESTNSTTPKAITAKAAAPKTAVKKTTAKKDTPAKIVTPKSTAAKPKVTKTTAPKPASAKSKTPQTDSLEASTAQAGTTRAGHSKQTARKSTGGRPPIKKAATKKEEVVKNESTDEDPSSDDWSGAEEAHIHSGAYGIDCPHIADEWPDFVPEEGQCLTLLYPGPEGVCWGSYDLGMFSGYFRSTSPPELRENGRGLYVRFEWRGRDASEGKTSFGRDCTGWLRRSRNGQIKGGFRGMYGELVEFEGRRSVQPEVAASLVSEYQAAFNAINQDNYDYENRARWGNSGW